MKLKHKNAQIFISLKANQINYINRIKNEKQIFINEKLKTFAF
jgi:hypothetical protein